MEDVLLSTISFEKTQTKKNDFLLLVQLEVVDCIPPTMHIKYGLVLVYLFFKYSSAS